MMRNGNKNRTSCRAIDKIKKSSIGQSTKEIARINDLIEDILSLRETYNILIELPHKEVLKIQKKAIIANYLSGSGRLLITDDNGIQRFIQYHKKD